MMQAFLWRFLVPRQEQLVAVTGSRPVPAVWLPLVPGVRVASDTPVRIPLGGTARVQIQAPPRLAGAPQTPLDAVRFRIASRPRGVSVRDTARTQNGLVLVLKADPNTCLVGDAANVILEASATPAPNRPWRTSARRGARVSLGALPAIPVEIVPPQNEPLAAAGPR
jgi:hypothetical protein